MKPINGFTSSDGEPTARFRLLNGQERWMAGVPFLMAGSLTAGVLFMLVTIGGLSVIGYSFDFDALPLGLQICANILLALVIVAGAVYAYRVFQHFSSDRQVLAYRLVNLLCHVAVAYFLTIVVALSLGLGNSPIAFFVILFMLAFPIGFRAWRSTYKRLANKPSAN